MLGLRPEPIIGVIGAFEGVTLRLLATLYPRAILIGWEPQADLAVRVTLQLRAMPWGAGPRPVRVVLPYGLAQGPGTRRLFVPGTDRASHWRDTPERMGDGTVMEAVRVEDAALELAAWSRWDLVILNAEGAEYEIIPRLAEAGVLETVGRFVVQFHQGLGFEDRHAETLAAMAATHEMDDSYAPAWHVFTRKLVTKKAPNRP